MDGSTLTTENPGQGRAWVLLYCLSYLLLGIELKSYWLKVLTRMLSQQLGWAKLEGSSAGLACITPRVAVSDHPAGTGAQDGLPHVTGS